MQNFRKNQIIPLSILYYKILFCYNIVAKKYSVKYAVDYQLIYIIQHFGGG